MTSELSKPTVVVVGLGYVGLPLAVALSGHFATTGYDIDQRRIDELKTGFDRTGEVAEDVLRGSSLVLTGDAQACAAADFYIVTVPTPVRDDKQPDLSIVEAASRLVAGWLVTACNGGRRPIVVFESTVYPGVTEDICVPILETGSGQICGRDFFVGYSPERINPGDREHTIGKITKVVAGQNADVLERMAALYGAVTAGGVFRAASIKVAEAAKVIENAQRDINIAFMNEITQIFSRLDISIWDVLAAANTKWNFLNFTPGLVGGHCIGVDPYYLSYRAQQLGYDPKVILSGRGVNDEMAGWLAQTIHALKPSAAETLVLGLTFKENVPDLRNSKVVDVISALTDLGHAVTVHDPLADAAEARHEYNLTLAADALERRYDLIVLAVPHAAYVDQGEKLRRLLNEGGIIADLKGVLGAAADWTI